MAVLADKKTQGAPFSNAMEVVRVVYDFSVDGGAVADYDVMVADSDCVVELLHASVKAAVTSGGALVMDLGKGAGGTEFMSDKAVAALTLDSVHMSDAPAKVKLAAADKIVMAIQAAAATAGKIEFVLGVMKY